MLVTSPSEGPRWSFPHRLTGLTAAGPFCDELLWSLRLFCVNSTSTRHRAEPAGYWGLTDVSCETERDGHHVDASSDCLVSFHDDQCGCLRSRHRLGFDDSHTRRARVRSDSSCRCRELCGQCADDLVHSSHSAGAMSEDSFSLAIPDRFRIRRGRSQDYKNPAFWRLHESEDQWPELKTSRLSRRR